MGITETLFKSSTNPAAQAAFERGFAYRLDGDFDSAIKEYREAIRLDPDFTAAYKKLGNAYRAKGGYWYDSPPRDVKDECFREAINAYSEVIRLDPEDFDTWSNRGCVHFSVERYDLAVSDYTEAIRVCSGNPSAIYGRRAEVYKKMRRFDLAVNDYTEQMKLDPQNYRYGVRASFYEEMGEFDLAMNDYTEQVRLDAHGFRNYIYRAEFYTRRGQYDLAINDYVRASNRGSLFDIWYCSHNPDDAEGRDIYSRMGDLYKANGEYERAIREYTLFLEMKNKWYLLDEDMEVSDDDEEEDEKGSEVAAEDPRKLSEGGSEVDVFMNDVDERRRNERCYCASVHVKRGRLYLSLGLNDKATADFKAALRHNPENKEALDELSGQEKK